MCKYSDNKWECPYENLPDSEYCIFHLKDENKNIEEFNKQINRILKSKEEIICFKGFYFPPRTANFSRKRFHNTIIFNNALFSGDVDFLGAEFLGDANFSGAEFLGGDFGEAKFSGKTDFIGAKFLGDVRFNGTKFSGEGHFSASEFLKYVNFSDAEFSRNTHFLGTKFSGDTLFIETKFSGSALFVGAKLSGNVRFHGIKFLENAYFQGAIFDGKIDFIHNDAKAIYFENTFFSDKVRIQANLSQCYLHGSNIEKVDLVGSTWSEDKNPRLLSKIFNFFFDSSIVIREASQGGLSSDWKTLEELYRRLKQSYQKSGDYETAGEFYYREMECKRKQLGFFQRKYWNIIYRGFCGYGEKPYNVAFVSILIISVFASIYFYSGIMVLGKNIINYDLSSVSFNFLWINDFLWCLYISVTAFTTMGYGDVLPIGWSRFFASIEAGIGIFMTALFIFVFTRKMLR